MARHSIILFIRCKLVAEPAKRHGQIAVAGGVAAVLLVGLAVLEAKPSTGATA